MHKLEYALFALSVIEDKVNKNSDLAKELKHLASMSHNYNSPTDKTQDLSDEYMETMHDKADKLI
jgi:hypothetical protein